MSKHKKGLYLAILCCVTYGFAYLCRINMSAAIDKLAAGFNTDTEAIGVLSSSFSITYAVGQLVCGYFIGRWNPRITMLGAVIGTALCNLIISRVDVYAVVFAVWVLNAAVQSLFWGTEIKIIGAYPETRSHTMMMSFGLVISVAYVISWSGIGSLLNKTSDWHPYFGIPAVIMLLIVPFWLTLKKACPEVEELQQTSVKRNLPETMHYLTQNHIFFYAGLEIITGIVKEGVFFWAPVLLARLLAGSNISPYITVVIVPLSKIPATVTMRFVMKKIKDYTLIYRIAYGTIAMLCLLVWVGSARFDWLFPVVLPILTYLSCCIATMSSGYIPLSFVGKENMGAMVTGLLDASIYIGGSLSSLVLGHVLADNNVLQVALFWMAMTGLGFIIVCLFGKKMQLRKVA